MIPGSHKIAGLQKRYIRNPNKCADDESMGFQGTNPVFQQSSYVPVAVNKCNNKIIKSL